ncbi:MAG: Asp23/Gls24 family envelope stress response protein [Lachnospiraceae bacterium]|jgi:uncharacterized alkaline shock family protein YloU|nr:Asp23/Gls24 family envelope stress response protein [Lachnospiraceae bacterium]MDD6715687.1 Asp23/Gls24 family envelope stress response protein [Bacillota bacterium]
MAENEKKDNKETKKEIGTVRIADDVVEMIAEYAAKEVEGVAGMSAGSTSNFLSKAGVRMPAARGVKAEVQDGNVRIDAAVIMDYGYNIPATSSKVQARIKQAIENMTGLNVTDVNIRIEGIRMPAKEN